MRGRCSIFVYGKSEEKERKGRKKRKKRQVEEKKKKKEKIGRKKRAPGGKAECARTPRATTPAFSSADGDDDGVVERVT